VPPTHLSFDDTDSLDGMCTTYLATLMIEALSEYDLIGLPRLVRLNPNVPWKTRGNAAISLSFGRGRGRSIKVGEIKGGDVRSFFEGSPAHEEEILAKASAAIGENAHFACEKTNPGMVVSAKRPAPELYWRTVREIVPLKDAEKEVAVAGGTRIKFKNGRGVIGAAAAMAWRPKDFTFELLSYRRPGRIGTKRRIDRESVARMDAAFPSTFHNLDPATKHIAIAPASPCPVLFGIRGDSPSDLLKARKRVISEEPDRWLLFLTNQGTDDHLLRRRISDVGPRQGAILRGKVSRKASYIAGGHVFFEIADRTGSITCAVYEPSGSVRSAARALMVGDAVEVYGSARKTPFELNVEKLHVLKLIPSGDKIENPICPKCGKHMKSAGRGAGYRCRKCGTRSPLSAAKLAERTAPEPGWYEPPVASRRHLYKPLKRFDIKRRSVRELLNTYPAVKSSKP
jgi:tRNA(Ile2)-agmatinylcytidine synthase